jgi:hypothetical protein
VGACAFAACYRSPTIGFVDAGREGPHAQLHLGQLDRGAFEVWVNACFFGFSTPYELLNPVVDQEPWYPLELA